MPKIIIQENMTDPSGNPMWVITAGETLEDKCWFVNTLIPLIKKQSQDYTLEDTGGLDGLEYYIYTNTLAFILTSLETMDFRYHIATSRGTLLEFMRWLFDADILAERYPDMQTLNMIENFLKERESD